MSPESSKPPGTAVQEDRGGLTLNKSATAEQRTQYGCMEDSITNTSSTFALVLDQMVGYLRGGDT